MKANIETGAKLQKKPVSIETFVFLGCLVLIFGYFGNVMGVGIMFKVMMNTAHDLILNTAFFIMGVAILAGAVSSLMSEFGVIALINKLLYPIMKPIYGLPGAASLGAVTTYMSDNPAILGLVEDKGFSKYFTKAQLATLVNLGTVFGMGLIITTFVLGLGDQYLPAILIGNFGAFVGGIVSIRLLLFFAKKEFAGEDVKVNDANDKAFDTREVLPGNIFERVLTSLLQGGKTGVTLGLSVIPGIVVVCTLVMMLTFGPSGGVVDGVAVYTGAAFEGVGLLPKIGELISPIIKPLFGFSTTEALALPITALGSAGSSMGMAKTLIDGGLMNIKDVAVYSAMAITFAGFLSTHVGMMDSIGMRKLTTKAIVTHLIGGLVAGVVANYLFMIIM